MNTHTIPKIQSPSHIKKALELGKDYFLNSEERVMAWFLAIGTIISVLGLVGLTAVFSWWTAGFWAALAAKDLALLITSMQWFALIITGYVGVSALKNYLIENLAIHWRTWLTQKLLTKYLYAENKYLDINHLSEQLKHPGQRIQEDIKSFVSLTLTLSTDFLGSTLSLVTFIGTLWVTGGTLSFVILGASITIPGYLVWMALIIAGSASAITQLLGSSLAELNHKGEGCEADFREQMESLHNEAENIAQERGEVYYKQSLSSKIQQIYSNSQQKNWVKTILISFQNFYMELSNILPYLLAAPLYFNGRIELGQLMQIGFAFNVVNSSLGWFISSYEIQAAYKASLTRIIELESALERNGLVSTQKSILVKEHELVDTIHIKNLNVARLSSTKLILKELNIRFNRGEHTLVKGPSGLGKSTLFKAIAGNWKYGGGEIFVPSFSKVCFLSQIPSFPNDTLKAVLAYPKPVNTYTEEQYIDALRAVNGMEHFIDKLDQKHTYSPGQKQRIAFARALLIKPDWLFLDEATASLDTLSERHVYTLIKNQLKNTTFISIAHRPTVDQFHKRIIHFAADSNGEMSLQNGVDNEKIEAINALRIN
jgi:putative ATP-binding cassette transporter